MKIKHLVLGVAGAFVLIASLPTFTKQTQTSMTVTEFSNTECKALADIGEDIARSRDKGISITTSLAMTKAATEMAAKGNEQIDPQIYNSLKGLTIELYENKYVTPEEAHKIIYNICLN